MLTTEIFQTAWCNIVFTGRNLQYGAYKLRLGYEKNLVRGLLSALLLPFLLIFPFQLYSYLHKDTRHVTIVDISNELVELKDMFKPLTPSSQQKQLTSKPSKTNTAPTIKRDVEIKNLPPDIITTANEPSMNPNATEGKGNSTGDKSGGPLVDNTIYDPVNLEEMPAFPGGEPALLNFLGSNIKYPAMAKAEGVSGKVYLTFVVDKNGEVKGIKILQGIGAGCDEEAMRVLGLLPKWTPGRNHGQAVAVKFTIPIKFLLH